MKTTVLPGGSVVPLVEIKFIRVQKHFWSDKCYVELEFKNGTTRSAVERVSHQDAMVARQELIEAVQLAYNEEDPFEHGYEMGRAAGHTAGRSCGLEEGRTEGYQQGYSDGRSEGFNQGHGDGYEVVLCQGHDQGATDERARILGRISHIREALIREQRLDGLPQRSVGGWQDRPVGENENPETPPGEPQELRLRRDLFETAMMHLNDRERHILSERRFCERPTTLEDLSRQYGISRERVHQIEVRALDKLEKAIKAAAIERRYRLHALSVLTDVAQAITPKSSIVPDE